MVSVEELDSKIEALESQLNRKNKQYSDHLKKLKDLEKIITYSQQVVEDKLTVLKDKIEPVINSMLQTVFVDEDLEFRFRADVKYGKTTFIPEIVDCGKGIVGTIDTTGGGVMVLSSVIMKMMFIMLEEKARILVLDETLNPISPKYRPKAAEFISKIAKELNFDILLITFDENNLIGDNSERVYKVEKDGRYSIIKKVKG